LTFYDASWLCVSWKTAAPISIANLRCEGRPVSLERQFISRMNRFVALWSALVSEYNEKQAFNIKLAGEVAKAFHELEKVKDG